MITTLTFQMQRHSNTTNVKVKQGRAPKGAAPMTNSNTTNVKVKPRRCCGGGGRWWRFKYNQC